MTQRTERGIVKGGRGDAEDHRTGGAVDRRATWTTFFAYSAELFA